MTTYNKIMDAFRSFVSSSKRINSFLVGRNVEDLTPHSIFPIMIVAPESASITGSQLSNTFVVGIYDILNSDGSNESEIQSDTQQMLFDFISFFRDNYETHNFYLDESSVSMQPDIQVFPDIASGWTATITIISVETLSKCNLPIK